MPVFYRNGRIGILHPKGSDDPEVEDWLPPPPEHPDAPVPPVRAAAALESEGRLLCADAGGLRTYDLDDHTWTCIRVDPGPSDWRVMRSEDSIFAFSPERKRVHVISRKDGKVDRTYEKAKDIAVTRKSAALLFEGGRLLKTGGIGGSEDTFLISEGNEGLDSRGETRGLAVDGGNLLMLTAEGSVLRYRPLKGCAERLTAPWSERNIEELRSRGDTITARTEDGRVFARFGRGAWRTLARAPARPVGLWPFDSGILVAYEDGSIVRHSSSGEVQYLAGRTEPDLDLGDRILDGALTPRGIWLVGTSGLAFWREETRSLVKESHVSATSPWRGFVSSSAGVWAWWDDLVLELSADGAAPRIVARGGAWRDVAATDGALFGLTEDGALVRFKERDQDRLSVGTPAERPLEGRVTRAFRWSSGFLLGTENGGVGFYDAARRSLHVYRSEGSRIVDMGRVGRHAYVLDREGRLALYGPPEAGEAEQEIRGVRDLEVLGGSLWLLLESGSVVQRPPGRGESSGRVVVAPGRSRNPDRLLGVAPLEDGLVLHGPGTVWRYSPLTWRADRIDLRCAAPLPWRGRLAIAREGRTKIVAIPVRGEPFRWDLGAEVLSLRGDGREVAGHTKEVVFRLEDAGPRGVLRLPRRSAENGIVAAASAPGADVVHLLDGEGRLWRYGPENGAWESGPRLAGADEIFLRNGAPAYLAGFGELLEVAGSEKAVEARSREIEIQGRAVQDRNGDVFWVDRRGDLYRNGSRMWSIPIRVGSGQQHHWTLATSQGYVSRLTRGVLRLDAKGLPRYEAASPIPASAPDEILVREGSAWVRFGREVWLLGRGGSSVVCKGAGGILGQSRGKVIVRSEDGAVRDQDGRTILEAPPRDPVVRESVSAVVAPGSKDLIVARADGSLWYRHGSQLRDSWRRIRGEHVDRMIVRKGGLEVRGETDGRQDIRFFEATRIKPIDVLHARIDREGLFFEKPCDVKVDAKGFLIETMALFLGGILDLASWRRRLRAGILRDRLSGLLVSCADGLVWIAGGRFLDWRKIPGGKAAASDGRGNVAVLIDGQWWGVAALTGGAGRPTREWGSDGSLGVSLHPVVEKPFVAHVGPLSFFAKWRDPSDVVEAGGWPGPDGTWWVYAAEAGYVALRKQGEAMVLASGARYPRRGWAADLTDEELAWLTENADNLRSGLVAATRVGLILRGPRGLLHVSPYGVRRLSREQATEMLAQPRAATVAVDRFGLLPGEREVRVYTSRDRILADWNGKVYELRGDAWEPASRLSPPDLVVPYRIPAGVEVGRDAVAYMQDQGRSKILDLRKGVFRHHEIVELRTQGAGVVAWFADGGFRTWKAGIWSPWEADPPPSWKPRRFRLAPPFTMVDGELRVTMEDVVVSLTDSDGSSGFRCDRPTEVLPGRGGNYVLTPEVLWWVQGGRRRAVRKVLMGNLARLALTPSGRPVFFDGERSRELDGGQARNSTPTELRDHPCQGRMIWKDLSIVCRQGVEPRFTLHVAGGDWETRFVGDGFAHDLASRLAVFQGRVWIIPSSNAPAWTPTGKGARLFARDIRKVPRERPEIVTGEKTTLRLRLQGDAYVIEAPAAKGWSRVSFSRARDGLEIDRPRRMAAWGTAWVFLTADGLVVQPRDALGDLRLLPSPPGGPVQALRSTDDGVLWADSPYGVWRLVNGRWNPGERSGSPFDYLAHRLGPAETENPWDFRGISGRLCILRRFADGFSPVVFDPDNGNFDFATIARGVSGRGRDGIAVERTGRTRLRTRAGTLVMPPGGRNSGSPTSTWVGQEEYDEAVGNTGMIVRTMTSGESILLCRNSVDGLQRVKTKVWHGRIPRDRVQDIEAVPGTERIILATLDGLRDWDLAGTSHPALGEVCFLPGNSERGAHIQLARDDRKVAARFASGQVFLSAGKRGGWTAAGPGGWRSLGTRPDGGSGTLDTRALSWQRGEHGIELLVGEARTPVAIGPQGLNLDRPDDAAVLKDSSVLLVGGILWAGGVRAPVDRFVSGGPAVRLSDAVWKPRGGGARAGVAVVRPDGKAQVLHRDAEPQGTVSARESWDAHTLPHRVVRGEEGAFRVEWRSAIALEGRVEGGRFLHDVVRDVLPHNGRLVLATDGGLVLRDFSGHWLDHEPMSVTRVLRTNDGIVAVGEEGAFAVDVVGGRIVRRGPVPAKPEIVYQDPVMRLERTPLGPRLLAKVGTSGRMIPVSSRTVDDGLFPWDVVEAVIGFPEHPGELCVVTSRSAYACDSALRPKGALQTLGIPDPFRVERHAGQVFLTSGSPRRTRILTIAADGTTKSCGPGPYTAARMRAVEVGRWVFRGPDERGRLDVRYRFENGAAPLAVSRGCFDIDCALALEATERWAAFVTRAGIGLWDPSRGRVRHVHLDGATMFAGKTAVTEEGDIIFRRPNGDGVIVRPDGRVESAEAALLDRIGLERLATWPGGGLVRRAGVLEYRDAATRRHASGEAIFANERFAWDNGLEVRGPFLRTSAGLERWDGRSLRPVDDPAAKRSFQKLDHARRHATFRDGNVTIEVLPEGVRVNGLWLREPAGPVLGVVRAARRLWVATAKGVRYLRLESRWLARIAQEAQKSPR